MDRFDALRVFVRVVEARSFTRAAQTLHMSRTTVTQTVQQLEAHLRVKLLHRTTRQVQVTPDGAAYHQRVLRVLAELEDADTSLSVAAAAPRGRLRVDVPSPLARLVLVPALPAFHVRYPEIQLDMGVSDRLVDVIGDHVDCVIRGGELRDSTLKARRVGALPIGVYAAPAYLRLAGVPQHPAEMDGTHHRIVGFLRANGRTAPMAMRRDGEQVDVQGRYAVALDDGNAYLAAGLAGLGVLWLPTYMAESHAAAGELVRLFDDWDIEAMPLYVIHPPHRHVSAKMRVFMDWVEEVLRAQADLQASRGLLPKP